MITKKDVKIIIDFLNKCKKEKRSIEIVIIANRIMGCANLFFYNGNYKINYYSVLNELHIVRAKQNNNDNREDVVNIDLGNIADYILRVESENFYLKLIDSDSVISIIITNI